MDRNGNSILSENVIIVICTLSEMYFLIHSDKKGKPH